MALERTFVMVKPDGVQRGLVGTILGRFEARGLKLVALRMLRADHELLGQHYAEHRDRAFFPQLLGYASSGPVVATVWEGRGAVAAARAVIGATDPIKSPPGSLRGDLALLSGRNLVHGSDSTASADREIGLWFGEGSEAKLVQWTPSMQEWTAREHGEEDHEQNVASAGT